MDIKKTIFVIASAIIILTSCNEEQRYAQEVKELTGRTVVFPNGYKRVSAHGDDCNYDVRKHGSKIVMYVDYSEGCIECCVKMLESRERQIEEITGCSNCFIVVFTNVDFNKLQEAVASCNITSSMLFYPTDIFGKKNGLCGKLAVNKTFMIDENNEVVLVGEPFENERLSLLYKRTIRLGEHQLYN